MDPGFQAAGFTTHTVRSPPAAGESITSLSVRPSTASCETTAAGAGGLAGRVTAGSAMLWQPVTATMRASHVRIFFTQS
ncbi:hypothetical protein GCM10010116_38610 [Microbispora rosea subsp. aerata]|nr:hypothetical protein GCM10010116_38610 [Microbispora rosea subsp. aerata]GLJ81430.1 hypothetical protein GCM10017588_01530 [Microbispora rosea subsp. aerata]